MLNVRNFTLTTAAAAFTIAALDTADGQVKQATAATDNIVGVFDELDLTSGSRADVTRLGTKRVRYGGAVTRGAPLTANSAGRAVTAAPAAGANVKIIGYAEVSGVDGDIAEMLINVQTYQG